MKVMALALDNKVLETQVLVLASLVVFEAWPWPRGASRTPDEGL